MKGAKFEWSQKCQDIFDKIKHLLTTTHILKLVDSYKEFIIYMENCKEGLGGVLLQEGHVVSYDSRKIKDHEKNYRPDDLKLDAIIHALKMWYHYFLGKGSY